MIFGKSLSEQHRLEQDRLKALHKKRTPHFALIPIRLVNHQWAWLTTVYKDHRVTHRFGTYQQDTGVPDYHLTQQR